MFIALIKNLMFIDLNLRTVSNDIKYIDATRDGMTQYIYIQKKKFCNDQKFMRELLLS